MIYRRMWILHLQIRLFRKPVSTAKRKKLPSVMMYIRQFVDQSEDLTACYLARIWFSRSRSKKRLLLAKMIRALWVSLGTKWLIQTAASLIWGLTSISGRNIPYRASQQLFRDSSHANIAWISWQICYRSSWGSFRKHMRVRKYGCFPTDSWISAQVCWRKARSNRCHAARATSKYRLGGTNFVSSRGSCSAESWGLLKRRM